MWFALLDYIPLAASQHYTNLQFSRPDITWADRHLTIPSYQANKKQISTGVSFIAVTHNWTKCMVRPVLQLKIQNNGNGLR